MQSDPRLPEDVAKSGPARGADRGSMGRDLRRLAAVAVLGVGLLGVGLAEQPAPAIAQLKPGVPASTLSFADIVERVKPAVVSVSTTNEVKVADRGEIAAVPGHPRACPRITR